MNQKYNEYWLHDPDNDIFNGVQWNRLYEDETDPRWRIIERANSVHLYHGCNPDKAGFLWVGKHVCMYCGEPEPEELRGFFKLVRWGFDHELG